MLWLESELNIVFELKKKLIEKNPENATIANRSQPPTPNGREKEKKRKKKKKKKKHARNKLKIHEKHIDQSPLPKRGILGYFAIFLTLHKLYKRGLIQTRPLL